LNPVGVDPDLDPTLEEEPDLTDKKKKSGSVSDLNIQTGTDHYPYADSNLTKNPRSGSRNRIGMNWRGRGQINNANNIALIKQKCHCDMCHDKDQNFQFKIRKIKFLASKEVKQRHGQFAPPPNTIKEYFIPIL